jgi:hypothetical protein
MAVALARPYVWLRRFPTSTWPQEEDLSNDHCRQKVPSDPKKTPLHRFGRFKDAPILAQVVVSEFRQPSSQKRPNLPSWPEILDGAKIVAINQ